MDQVTTGAGEDQAEALRFALRLGELPLFQPVLREAETFWSPDLPPAVVLLGSLGQTFAAGFHTLGSGSRQWVANLIDRAMESGSDYLQTVVATGFLEAVIHRAESDGTWPALAAALGPQSRRFADDYRSHPFHGMDAEAAPVPDDRAPGMGM